MNLRRSAFLALMVSASIFALTSCGKSTRIASSDPVLDPAPPAAPSNLHSAYLDAAGYDYLYWGASTSSTVTGYEIYQSATSGGTLTYVTSTGPNASNIILPNVSADCTLYYQVRARAGSTYSAYSAPLAIVRHAVVAVGAGGGAPGGIGQRIAD